MARTRIGISGWRYAGWRNSFYPEDLTQARELEYASRQVQTIEINGSHYALQTPQRYENWYQATPKGFIFSVKAPRYLTHVLRFRDPDASHAALANFFASGVLRLEEKLGPFLWQFPPSFQYDPDLMERMLACLPRSTKEAAALAREHDAHVKDVFTETRALRWLRHAVEIRHDSFCDPGFIRQLRRHRVALVIADARRQWPQAEDITAGFVYMRLHGATALYSGKYSDEAISRWAARIKLWQAGREPEDADRILNKAARKRNGRDVYCYFDNDKKVQAPRDAIRLIDQLKH